MDSPECSIRTLYSDRIFAGVHRTRLEPPRILSKYCNRSSPGVQSGHQNARSERLQIMASTTIPR